MQNLDWDPRAHHSPPRPCRNATVGIPGSDATCFGGAAPGGEARPWPGGLEASASPGPHTCARSPDRGTEDPLNFLSATPSFGEGRSYGKTSGGGARSLQAQLRRSPLLCSWCPGSEEGVLQVSRGRNARRCDRALLPPSLKPPAEIAFISSDLKDCTKILSKYFSQTNVPK